MAQTIAFPGAEGFGKYATGGRNGQVVAVTNLKDDGEGSFRYALEQFPGEPLTIVFNISGIIELQSKINIKRSTLTIAGQQSSGDSGMGLTEDQTPADPYYIKAMTADLDPATCQGVVASSGDFSLRDTAGGHCDGFRGKQLIAAILKQKEDQYAHSAVVEQIIAVYTTKQGNLSNAQWYEQFNTRVDGAKSVGVDFGYQVLWEYSANKQYSMEFYSLSVQEQIEVRKVAEERHLAYLMIQNASSKHDNLRRDLQNDFTKGSD
jgi:hypothetical protein